MLDYSAISSSTYHQIPITLNPTANLKRSIAILIAILTAVFILMVTVTLPSDDKTYNSLQNFSHFLVFALLSFLVLRLCLGITGRQWAKAVLVSGVCLISLGIVIEWYQYGMPGRNAELSDFVLDVAGIVAGFLAFFALSMLRAGKRSLAALVLCLVLVLTFGFARSSIKLVGFDLFRPSLPVVRAFDHPFASGKIEARDDAQFYLIPASEHESGGLRVRFRPVGYSGIVFFESPANWSDYSHLSVKIFSSLKDTRQIELRINDRLHNNQYADRYNTTLLISPGLNDLRIPLHDVKKMGRPVPDRSMNINDISQLQIFTSEIDSEFTLDVRRIELF